MKSLIVLSLIFQVSVASASLNCSSAQVVLKNVKDDRCAALSDAAEGCFDRLNQKFAAFKLKPTPTLASSLQSDFDRGLVALDGYFPHLKKLRCGDQEEEVKVFVEEITSDLEELKTLSEKSN